jgi:hypothetical protein
MPQGKALKMPRLSPSCSGEPQLIIACMLDRSRARSVCASRTRWYWIGTIAVCVMPSASTVSRKACASKRGCTMSVPPASSVHSMATQEMFEYRPMVSSVRAPP